MIKRELAVFLVVGVLAVVIDFVVYRGLVMLALAGIDSAKSIGFLSGTVFAYFANRYWTFGAQQHAHSSVWRFVLLYGVTLCANVFVNATILKWTEGMTMAVSFAYLMATGVSASLNFIGMKWFVFKTNELAEVS